jgi:hypothetical protein
MSDLSSLLAPIREREAAATEGPWETHFSDEDYPPVDYSIITSRYGDEVVCFDNHERKAGCQLATITADAEFIAASRTDVPRLLSALDAVEDLAKYLDTLAEGDQHYAALFRTAVTAALGEQA